MGPAHIREYCELDDTSKALTDAQRDESIGHERAGVPSRVEVGAEDRGFSWGG
jgi:hypothetical protein